MAVFSEAPAAKAVLITRAAVSFSHHVLPRARNKPHPAPFPLQCRNQSLTAGVVEEAPGAAAESDFLSGSICLCIHGTLTKDRH